MLKHISILFLVGLFTQCKSRSHLIDNKSPEQKETSRKIKNSAFRLVHAFPAWDATNFKSDGKLIEKTIQKQKFWKASINTDWRSNYIEYYICKTPKAGCTNPPSQKIKKVYNKAFFLSDLEANKNFSVYIRACIRKEKVQKKVLYVLKIGNNSELTKKTK